MAVGVTVVADGVADKAVWTAFVHQTVDGAPNVVGVFALGRRRAFAEHGHPSERRHSSRVTALSGPVAELVLVVSEVVETFADDFTGARIIDGCTGRCRRRQAAHNRQPNWNGRLFHIVTKSVLR